MSMALTANDYERSCTSHSLDKVSRSLRSARGSGGAARILDVGCGFGGVAATLKDELGAREAHGVDIDERVIAEARSKGVHARRVDVACEALPYDDASFDIVTCFGVLDYFVTFDDVIAELSRVLVPRGMVAISLPNLASWHNRLALLLGYQPRDVEFTKLGAVGVAPYYRKTIPVGHIHTPTTLAFRRFMSLMGFEETKTVPLTPAGERAGRAGRVVMTVDSLLGRSSSLARRFLYIGERASDPPTSPADGWWASLPSESGSASGTGGSIEQSL